MSPLKKMIYIVEIDLCIIPCSCITLLLHHKIYINLYKLQTHFPRRCWARSQRQVSQTVYIPPNGFSTGKCLEEYSYLTLKALSLEVLAREHCVLGYTEALEQPDPSKAVLRSQKAFGRTY